MTPDLVALDTINAAAHGFTPGDVTHAPVGAWLVAADGTAVRVTETGALDPWPPQGRRSIASDPSARRRVHDPRTPTPLQVEHLHRKD